MGTIICRHDRLRRQCDECDMSEEIAQLRADLARVTAELDEAIEDRRQARDDAARAAALLAVRTMERDARPAISREDAALKPRSLGHQIGYSKAEWDACLRIENALRAHAAGSGKGGTDA